MARVTVDFSDVQDFEPVEKGEYPAIVEKVEMRLAEDTGKEYNYLNWEFTSIESIDGRNAKFWLVTSFSPKALFRLKEVCDNLGLPTDEIEFDYDEDSMLVIDPELAGLPCVLAVSQDTYEGRKVNRVDAVLPPDSPQQGAKTGRGSKSAPAKRSSAKRSTSKRSTSKRTFK